MRKLNLILSLLVLTLFSACELETVKNLDELSESAKNHADMSGEFNTVFEFVNSIGTEDPVLSGKTGYGLLTSCASASIDGVNRILTVDFGTTGCLCKDGISRTGVLTAVFTGDYRTVGSSVTVTMTDYTVNDIPFSGTITIENLGNQNGNYTYSYEVENASAVFPFATLSWSTIAVIERIEGDSTQNIWDDVYEIEGSSSGVNGYGNSYTVETEVPLIKVNQEDCLRNFISGILILTDSKNNTIRLDYDPIGAQQCDKTAELTINDYEPFIINLR